MEHVHKPSLRAWNGPNVFLNSEKIPYKFVYRLQNCVGFGPFRENERAFKCLPWMKTVKKKSLFYMRPDQDFCWLHLYGLGFYNKPRPYEILFGFSTISQIFRWFDRKALNALKEDGFSIVRRTASLVVSSDLQCLFIPYPNKSLPVETYWQDFIFKRKYFEREDKNEMRNSRIQNN